MGTLRVRNLAQKVLWENELSGQISDGQWENATPHNHWEPWCRATVVVDPDNVGRDFYARRESYNFSAPDLLSVVGERMVEYVRRATGDATYDAKRMRADLNDLKKIIKERTRGDAPIPPQPTPRYAKLIVDGWPQQFTVYYEVDDDPRAVEALAAREREGAEYRLKQLEKKLVERQAETAKLAAEATALREKLGLLV